MGVTTKAYVVEEKGGPFVLKDVVLDETRPDEVLVEIKYTGICHTDLVFQHGYMPISYPAVLGHEGVGIIREIGSNVTNKSLQEGDTVFLSFRTCLECPPCRRGHHGACPQMSELNFFRGRLDQTAPSPISYPDGTPVRGQFFGQSSFSRLALVSERSVVKCEEGIADALLAPLAPLGCGYLTGAGAVINVFDPPPESKMVILGMGAVGMAALLAAKALGVQTVVAVDMVEEKLALAKELGANQAIDTRVHTDLAAAIREECPGGADYILDATGAPSLLQASVAALGHGGILALVGAPPLSMNLEVNAVDLMLNCKRIVGVIEGYADPQKLIPHLVRWYQEGKFPVDRLVKVYPAIDLEMALHDHKLGKVVKPIISWEGL